MKYIVLYNPYAGDGWKTEKQSSVEKTLPVEVTFCDMTGVDYSELFASMDNDTRIVIVGGDGTLNRFINDTSALDRPEHIMYIPGGSGNDFLHDVKGEDDGEPIELDEYIKELPTVEINGEETSFLNGIGYGIDGYCCRVGDEVKEKQKKKPNYTAIAIKGLLYGFSPVNAVVTVDGVRHEYKNVWLAPTMNGRYYGGGMKPTPNQDRLNSDNKLSVLVWHEKSKLKTLMVFPKIFEGEHIKYDSMCEVLTGREISVEFDSPTDLQIDGETVKGVRSYSARSFGVR